jgi:hypothetical protein
MATSGEIAEILIEELGMSKGTVQLYAQTIRDAGMLTKGGRGLSAAMMSIEDVTNWLLAVCSSETAAAAPEEVRITREAPLDELTSTISADITRSLHVGKAKTAGEAVELLIDDIIEGRVARWREQSSATPSQGTESWHLGILRPTITVEFVVAGQQVLIHFSKPTEAGKVRRASMNFAHVDAMFKMRKRTITDWNSPTAMGSLTRVNRVGPHVFQRLADAVGLSFRDDAAIESLA